MRLRDLFRGPSTNDRKLTSTILPTLDASTFINAAQERDTDILQKYLLAGFPVDQPDPITKATALHVAAEAGNFRAIQILLQAGAQVNVYDLSLSTPLHIAAYMGYEEIVQMLLMHGADIFQQDNTGRNAFHLAVSTGNNRLIQYFLSNYDAEQDILQTSDAQKWTPLMCACASNHPSTCALLLSNSVDLCAVNDQGMNVFHIAAFFGSLPIIHELLHSSYDDDLLLKALNQGDQKNQTPLFHACLEGHTNVVLILLHAGANAYHLDHENQTCLHAMLSSSILLKRHIRLFYRLIELVDYRSSEDNLSRTLLDLAYVHQLNTIISLLTLLHYKRNYSILSTMDSVATPLLSLRHLCILAFKRSIYYHRTEKQASQHELLKNAFHQCFQIPSSGESGSMDVPYQSSLDDLPQANKKSSKSTKKSRKSSNTNSDNEQSTPPPPPQSSWSIFTNKFKSQRSFNSPQDSFHLSMSASPHPMKYLASAILTSPTKLDDLLDFPSLNQNPLLDDDMKTIVNTYGLAGPDSSNQI